MITGTELLELFAKRQSVRGYTSQPVETEKLQNCIEAARLSPSACNSQPWKFIVVNDPEVKKKLEPAIRSRMLGINVFIQEAPVLVVVVREAPNLTSKVGTVLKDKPYTIMDVGIATLQFCLQATAEGLSTCMMGWFDEDKVKKILDIPKSKRAELVLTVGYAKKDEIRPKIRKKTEDIVSYNKY